MHKNNIDNLRFEHSYEHERLNETEIKLVPKNPEQFAELRGETKFLTQVYLSHPSEPYNLRIRETISRDGASAYTATLKDTGEIIDGAKSRLEIETTISKETYEFYAQQPHYPRLQKERAKLIDGVTIDWFENGDQLMEIESSAQLLGAFNRGLVLDPNDFIVASDDTRFDNESRAHQAFRDTTGHDALPIASDTPVELLARTIIDQVGSNEAPFVVTVSGRSGSGKTTKALQLIQLLYKNDPSRRPILLSTDDYNRGKTALDASLGGEAWTHWDDDFVTHTELFAEHLAQLKQGRSIPKHSFNFITQEPEIEGLVTPASIIIVEGIQADNPCLSELRDFAVRINTPFATSTGNRLVRDFLEAERSNTSMGSAQDGLRYILEVVEPTHQQRARL